LPEPPLVENELRVVTYGESRRDQDRVRLPLERRAEVWPALGEPIRELRGQARTGGHDSERLVAGPALETSQGRDGELLQQDERGLVLDSESNHSFELPHRPARTRVPVEDVPGPDEQGGGR
jgi:hypothetical protein